jgi:hypothetical protein
MRNYLNSPLDQRTRCYFWDSLFGGSKGDPGKVNREREQKGINLADDAYGKAMAAIKTYVDKSIAAANAIIPQEQQRASDYKSLIAAANDEYSTSMADALASFDSKSNAVYDELQGFIGNYEERSKGIVTRSGQEAVDFNLRNVDNFISFADSLTNSAFRTRQNLIGQANPYQLAQQEQIGRNNLEMLQGRLPADVMAAVSRQSAFGALQGGFGAGSSMGGALAARNLGLTSLDAARMADQSAQNWAKLIYDTQVSGLQTTAGQTADYLGISSKDALTVNQRNNENLLAAQQNYTGQKLTGLNTALGIQQQTGRDIFAMQGDVGKTTYIGGLDAVLKTAAYKTSAYDRASTNSVAAASQWGDWRQSINNTAWQNQLQEEADKSKRAAAGLQTITTLAGAALGSFVPGAGTLMGAQLGSSLGGSLGQAAYGGGSYGGPSASKSSFDINSLLGMGSSLSSMMTGGLDSKSGFYGSATGAANAWGKDPSEISRAGLGQYYYTPAGRYGVGDKSFSYI